jgi:quinol monooxygenase YgiN
VLAGACGVGKSDALFFRRGTARLDLIETRVLGTGVVHTYRDHRVSDNGGLMLVVVARYVVIEGHESAVERLLRQNAKASRAEPGCLEFSVYEDIDNPRMILLYERYTSEDAFQAHRRTQHFRDIIEQRVAPLLEQRAWSRMEPLLD